VLNILFESLDTYMTGFKLNAEDNVRQLIYTVHTHINTYINIYTHT